MSSSMTQPIGPTHMSRCFNCAEKGHVSKQCPKPQTRMCYNCQESGHLSMACPVGKYCHSCGDPNHLISVCPIRGPQCYKCGIKGHFAKQCHSSKPYMDDASNLLSLISERCCYSCGHCSHSNLCCQLGRSF